MKQITETYSYLDGKCKYFISVYCFVHYLRNNRNFHWWITLNKYILFFIKKKKTNKNKQVTFFFVQAYNFGQVWLTFRFLFTDILKLMSPHLGSRLS